MAASMRADTGIVQDMREQDEQKHKMRTACAPPLLEPPCREPRTGEHGLTACACAACGRRLGRHRDRSRDQPHTRPVARDRRGDEEAVWQLRAVTIRNEEMSPPHRHPPASPPKAQSRGRCVVVQRIRTSAVCRYHICSWCSALGSASSWPHGHAGNCSGVIQMFSASCRSQDVPSFPRVSPASQ